MARCRIGEGEKDSDSARSLDDSEESEDNSIV